MCLKWADPCGEPLFVSAALVKFSLYAPCSVNLQVISHLTCHLPVRPAGHHGNRRDASAGVGLSIYLYTSHSCIYI